MPLAIALRFLKINDFPYQLTIHAQQVIAARNIPLAWVARVLSSPDRTEPHLHDPELRYALARIPEYGDRVLRVVYNETTTPWKVVTVYFDRTQKNRL